MRLIDADALMNELQSMVMYENDGAVDCGSYNTAIIDAKAAISSAPTLSPDDVRGVGEWIKLGAHKGMEQYKCSVCETPTYVPECTNDPMYGYCPNCGARMSRAEAEKAMEVRG